MPSSYPPFKSNYPGEKTTRRPLTAYEAEQWYVGDVFELVNGVLTLKVVDTSQSKSGNRLSVKLKSGGGITAGADGLYIGLTGHVDGMRVSIYDASTLYIWGGSIEINGSIYNTTSQISFATGTLTEDTKYYLYVSAPGSGSTLTSADFSLSTTAPAYDHAKAAYYKSDDGAKRWLANVKTAA